MSRLTPAQRRGLKLLARPGAEARTDRSTSSWRVVDGDGEHLGRVHAGSLLALRLAGFAVMDLARYDQDGPVQRITAAGRAYLAPREDDA